MIKITHVSVDKAVSGKDPIIRYFNGKPYAIAEKSKNQRMLKTIAKKEYSKNYYYRIIKNKKGFYLLYYRPKNR